MAVIIAGNSYRFKSVSDTDKYLNILTDGDLDDGINVTTYGLNENDLGQVWLTSVYIHGNPMQYLLKSAKDNRFALDRWRINNAKYNNADIYSIGATTEDIYDQVVVFEPSGSYYKIKLAYRDNLYLTVTDENTYGNGHNVAWAAATGGNNQLWLAEPYSSGTGDSSNDGTSIYTGILARNTTISTTTAPNPIIINEIPDKASDFAPSYIEDGCEFHPSCGLFNGMNFNSEPEGEKIKEQLRKYIKIVFGDPNLTMEDKELCYYLFGERIANGGENQFHPGVDINYYEGAPIHPLFPGFITGYSETDFGRVSINVPELNITTTYVHMRDVCDELTEAQKNGTEKVYPSNIIGKESGRGATSYNDYDPHLHFEVTPYGSSTYAIPKKYPSVQMTSILPYGYMDGVLNP